MKILETTLRRIMTDYIHRRLHFKTKMEWQSQFAKEKIIVLLEERPASQESLGYHLMDEADPERRAT